MMKIRWEIVAISTGKREQLCDTKEHAINVLRLMQVEGRDRYKLNEIKLYETHEQVIEQ